MTASSIGQATPQDTTTRDPRLERLRQLAGELVALQRGLVAAYRWAASRTTDPVRPKLHDFRRSHERHLARLEPFAEAIGATAQPLPDLGPIDNVLEPLTVLLQHEDAAAHAYDEALQHALAFPEVRAALQEARNDAHRRWAWLALHVDNSTRLPA